LIYRLFVVKRSGMARVLEVFHSFTCTPTRSSAIGVSHTCLCLPSRSWYSFYRPRRDGRLSRPWCEVAPAESRPCNLPIANPALYHTATSAPTLVADADKPRDAFRCQSRSSNIVPFHTLGIVSSCAIVTLSLRYSTSKNVMTLKSVSEVTQDHRKWYHSIDCVWFPFSVL